MEEYGEEKETKRGVVETEHARLGGVEGTSGAIHKDISVGYREAPFFLFVLSPHRSYIACGFIDLILLARPRNYAIAISFRWPRNRWLISEEKETNSREK